MRVFLTIGYGVNEDNPYKNKAVFDRKNSIDDLKNNQLK
jgi:hypothetical protein